MDFGRYSEFVFAAYAVSGLTLAAVTAFAALRRRRARTRLAALERSRDD